MKLTIRKMQGVLLANLIILGLAACSSSPSPWSQQGDSPWKAKRDTDTTSAPTQEFVEIPVEEPVPVEPEPVMEEPMAIQEPEPAPMPMAAPAGNDVMTLPPSSYAVQVYAGASEDSVNRYRDAHGLQDLWSVKTDRNGSTIYVLVSIQNDRASANQAAADLEQKTGSKPWVRSIVGLQKIAVQ